MWAPPNWGVWGAAATALHGPLYIFVFFCSHRRLFKPALNQDRAVKRAYTVVNPVAPIMIQRNSLDWSGSKLEAVIINEIFDVKRRTNRLALIENC